MLYAIPNRFEMLSGDLLYYYNISTPNVPILFSGVVFTTSVYHFVSKLLSEKLKKKIEHISSSLTPIYFIQWIIIGNMYAVCVLHDLVLRIVFINCTIHTTALTD